VVLEKVPRSHQRVVLVVDATDESDHPGGSTNPALLPVELPDNVFVFLTRRPPLVQVQTLPGTPVHEPPLTIQRSDPHQQQAIRDYVRRRVAEDSGITARLRATSRPQAAEQLMSAVVDRSEENFMYAAFVLDDVAQGVEGELDWLDPVDQLPHGLIGYYHFFWNHFESGCRKNAAAWQEWEALHRPTLQFLVASGEMVPVQWLAGFVNRSAGEIEACVLRDWRRFLRATRDSNNRECWGVVHQSFVDYLAEYHGGELKLQDAHRRIADYYLTRWGGLEQGLPGLAVAEMAALDGGYGLRRVIRHLWQARRHAELCQVADQPFFAAQVQHFRSYQSTFEDLDLAVQAADSLGDRVRMLGLALAHAGLKANLDRLGRQEIIPLYARFGSVDRALRLTAEIADHAQRAETQVAVARELFPGSPEQASSLVDEVLARSGELSEYVRKTIFRHIACFLPKSLVGYLETAGDRETLLALIDHYFELYDGNAILFKLQRLEKPWLERLCETIRRALSKGDSPPASDLRLLLVLLYPDPYRAERALNEGPRAEPGEEGVRAVAEAIVQARRDRLALPGVILKPETIEHTLDCLLNPRIRGSETLLLLTQIVVPSERQFTEALRKLVPSWGKVTLLLDFGRVLLQRTGNLKAAIALLYDACRLRSPLTEQTGYDGFSSGAGDPLIRDIARTMARRGLQQTRDFLQELKSAGYPEDVSAFWQCCLGVVAETQPERACEEARQLEEPSRGWAERDIAVAIAGKNLQGALQLWRQLSPHFIGDRTKVLVEILQNASSVDAPAALAALVSAFRPEQQEQRFLYQIPVLAQAAASLMAVDREKAVDNLQRLLAVLEDSSFKWEGWSRTAKSVLLLRLVAPFATCGLLPQIRTLKWLMQDEDGLDKLVDPLVIRQLAEQVGDHPRAAAWANEHGHDLARAARHGLTFTYPERNRFNLIDNFDALADDPAMLRASRLLCMRLWHAETGRSWKVDHVKAFWAAIVAPLFENVGLRAARSIADDIEDKELQQLTLLTLAEHHQPEAVLEQWPTFAWLPPLRPLALLTLASHESDALKCAGLVDNAFLAATAALEHALKNGEAGEFFRQTIDLDMLLEFARRARSLNAARASDWLLTLVKRLRQVNPGAGVLFLPRLRNSFPADSPAEQEAVTALYRHWEDSLNMWLSQPRRRDGQPIPFQEVAHQCAEAVAYMARGLLLLDHSRASELVASAARYTEMIPESGYRLRSRHEILYALLAIPSGPGWSEAIRRSLSFGDALFHAFARFGNALLTLEAGNDAVANHLVKTIDWADRLMTL